MTIAKDKFGIDYPKGVFTICPTPFAANGDIDADSIRTIVEHRSDQPVKLFPLDGRPHLAHVRVETTNVSSYQALLNEVTP